MTPLLARGRDRLETLNVDAELFCKYCYPYSLGDAIDWKHICRSDTRQPYRTPTR